MPELAKATLQAVTADRDPQPFNGEEPVEVQFNPTSLKLKLSNETEGGRSRTRTKRQHMGQSSTVLTMDLVFDSADDYTLDANNVAQPVSVRTKTAILERFVVPASDDSQTPPRLRFRWEALELIGIVESLEIDFYFFAPNGAPLRAKVGLSIKEQDPKYMFLEAGSGARNDTNTQQAGGESSASPGSGTNGGGGKSSDRSRFALGGELAVDFAARMGLDPTAWRGLDADLGAGLSLSAGVEVGFSAGLSLSSGIGASAGVQAGLDVSLGAALGLEAEAGFNAAAGAMVSADTSAGFALAGAGGMGAAIEASKIVGSRVASESASLAYSTPGTSTRASTTTASLGGELARAAQTLGANDKSASSRATEVARPRQAHTPLASTGTRSYSAQQAAAPAPLPPTSDPRAVSFGFGVPLRERIATTTGQDQPRICTNDRTQSRRSEGAPRMRIDPTVPSWEQLPGRDKGREVADAAMAEKRAHPCGVLYTDKKR
jgi:hypothetical protein